MDDLTSSTIAHGDRERGVAVSSLWWTATNVLPYASTTIVSIVAARALGAHLMGRQSFIAFVTVLATEAAAAGVTVAVAQSVGSALGRQEPELIAPLLRSMLILEILIGAIVLVLFVGCAVAGATPAFAWVLAGITVLVAVAGRVPEGILMGCGRWRPLSLAIVSMQFAAAVATVLWLLAGGGITGIVAVRLGATSAQVAIFFVLSAWTVRELRPSRSQSRALVRPTLRYAAGISGTILVSILVYQRTEFLFLKGWSTDSEIAYYAIAVAAVSALCALPLSVGAVLSPALASLYGAGDESGVRTTFHRILRGSLLVTIPLTGAAAALGPTVVDLIYGSEYRSVGTVLLILLPTVLFAAFQGPSAAVLVAGRHIRAPLAAVSVALAVDLVAAATLVPSFGADGAAIANSLAQGTAALLTTVFALRITGSRNLNLGGPLRVAAVSAVSAVAAAAVLRALDETLLSLAIGGAIFVGALAVGLLVAKPLEADDASGFGRTLQRRPWMRTIVARATR